MGEKYREGSRPPDVSNVIPLAVVRRRQEESVPFFTETERLALRRMLHEFEAIKGACPTARRLLRED